MVSHLKLANFFENFTILVVWGANNLSRPGGYITRVTWVNNKYRFPGLIVLNRACKIVIIYFAGYILIPAGKGYLIIPPFFFGNI